MPNKKRVEEQDVLFKERKHRGGKFKKETLKRLRAGNSSNRKRINKWVSKILGLEAMLNKLQEEDKKKDEALDLLTQQVSTLQESIKKLNETLNKLNAK